MGLIFSNEFHSQLLPIENTMAQQVPVDDRLMIEALNFVFPETSFEKPDNGLYFNQIYVPEEVLILIFSHLPIYDVLKLRLVCKKWYNILKIHSLWSTIYFRKYKKIPKPVPWYIFYTLFRTKYFTGNLLKNNCGQDNFNHWHILENGGNKFKVEKKPCGCDPCPTDCLEFNKRTSCFVTSFGLCYKVQNIPLSGNLINFIVNKHKPHIYASEWVAGRFDCGGSYALEVKLYSTSSGFKLVDANEHIAEEFDYFEEESRTSIVETLVDKRIEFEYGGNEATQWKKMELLLKDYPDDVGGIVFGHTGQDNQFWRGHYGPKMAGGFVQLLFDSIEVQPDIPTYDENDEEIN